MRGTVEIELDRTQRLEGSLSWTPTGCCRFPVQKNGRGPRDHLQGAGYTRGYRAPELGGEPTDEYVVASAGLVPTRNMIDGGVGRQGPAVGRVAPGGAWFPGVSSKSCPLSSRRWFCWTGSNMSARSMPRLHRTCWWGRICRVVRHVGRHLDWGLRRPTC